MPIYEYSCGSCNERFELLVPMSESTVLPPCPSCRSPETRKLLSLFAGHGSKSSGGDSGPSSPGASSGSGGHCGPGSCGCGRF